MKLSPQWLRDFVDLTVDNHRLAEDLTSVGIAVEGISGEGENTVFEMEIGTNRPDAMNHYGVAREASAIYDLPLKPLAANLPENPTAKPSPDQLRVVLLKSRPSRSKSPSPISAHASPHACFAMSRSSRRPRRSRSGSPCSTSAPSTTRSMPPTTCSGKWASPRTSSISICSKAAKSSFAARAMARN